MHPDWVEFKPKGYKHPIIIRRTKLEGYIEYDKSSDGLQRLLVKVIWSLRQQAEIDFKSISRLEEERCVLPEGSAPETQYNLEYYQRSFDRNIADRDKKIARYVHFFGPLPRWV